MSESHLPEELAVAPTSPDRNLALELVRVTEAAAMAAGRWVGRGDKNGADGVAVISALSLAPDPAQAARDLRAVVDAALKRRGQS